MATRDAVAVIRDGALYVLELGGLTGASASSWRRLACPLEAATSLALYRDRVVVASAEAVFTAQVAEDRWEPVACRGVLQLAVVDEETSEGAVQTRLYARTADDAFVFVPGNLAFMPLGAGPARALAPRFRAAAACGAALEKRLEWAATVGGTARGGKRVCVPPDP